MAWEEVGGKLLAGVCLMGRKATDERDSTQDAASQWEGITNSSTSWKDSLEEN